MKRVELQLTEKIVCQQIGVKPLYFRPPYSIDQDPDVADQVRPLSLCKVKLHHGGFQIDPNDWKKGKAPRRSSPR